MIEDNIYEKMSTAEVKTVFDNEKLDFVINLELLNGCAHKCSGCFVNRNNQIETTNVKKAYELAKSLTDEGLRFREVIISPTDLFSANNAEEILLNKDFQAMLRLNDKTRITSTAMFNNTDIADVKRIFSILDNVEYFRKDMIMEFLVPLEADKIISDDSDYYHKNMEIIDFFKTQTTKIVDWSFVVNVHKDVSFLDNFEMISKIVKEKYEGIIEFLPSFFRTGNDSLIERHLEEWKQFLNNTINAENYKDLMVTIADMHHNSLNTIVLNYKKGELYISPFIYEQILFEDENLRIDSLTVKDVFDKIIQETVKQYNYAPKTEECEDCSYLTTCVGRNVLSFMETRNIKSCFYPKDALSLYDSVSPPRIKRCVNDN